MISLMPGLTQLGRWHTQARFWLDWELETPVRWFVTMPDALPSRSLRMAKISTAHLWHLTLTEKFKKQIIVKAITVREGAPKTVASYLLW